METETAFWGLIRARRRAKVRIQTADSPAFGVNKEKKKKTVQVQKLLVSVTLEAGAG